MAQISISNLSDGSALLNDSESFLVDLSEAELQISGGGCYGGKGSGKSGKSKKSGKGSGKSGKGSGKSGKGGCYCH